MRWLVEAADTKTGQETAITVEALSEAEAELLARYNGLLVSKVSRAVRPPPAPVVPYAATAPPEPEPPEFPHLVRRARATRVLGVVISWLGWSATAGGVGLFGYVALRAGWGDWADWRGWLPPAARASWRPVLGAVVALSIGSTLRLFAAAALVMPKLARRPAPREADLRVADAREAGGDAAAQ
jgi:hypothetical protein